MKFLFASAVGSLAFFILALPAHASDRCEAHTAQQNKDWARTSHTEFESKLHKEKVELDRTWCEIFEVHGINRLHNSEDFGRVLLTGEGLHPSVGTIVPGSGFAAGAELNLEHNLVNYPLRFNSTVESRGSYNGFWVAGGKLDVTGSSSTPQDRHIHASFLAQHSALAQLPYYGLGPNSSRTAMSLYGTGTTLASATVNVPLPNGFTVAGSSELLWTDTSGFTGSSTTPSIDRVFTAANTPGLDTSTAYIVPGVALDWAYPALPRIQGYSTDVSLGLQQFHEISGLAYSFRRINIAWRNRYSPGTNSKFGQFTVGGRFIGSKALRGNAVPFYLQPTIGGTDITGFDVLRSYQDYRFRAPNILTFQGEYERKLIDPLGLLLFYDMGKVAMTKGDLGFNHLTHSVGVGFTVRIGDVPVFKLYFAWGGREGTHTTYTGNTNNFLLSGSAQNGIF